MKLLKFIKKIEFLTIYIYLFIYGSISYYFLKTFPLVHSDESWLAGMTAAYLKSKSLFVTESFFDLMPRTVHTLKSLYHIIQIPFITVLGYTIDSVRLPSLIAGLLTLYFFYLHLNRFFKSSFISLSITILLSLNLQFVYASHFGRQEMLLFLAFIIAYSTYVKYPSKTYRPGLIIGISIGFHPNAFILGAMIGILILNETLLKKQSLKVLLSYIVILFGFALMYLGISLLANPDFFHQYFAYGKTLNVDALPLARLQNFRDFYLKLYHQITGTYYIPPLKTFFKLYVTLLVAGILVLLNTRRIPFSRKIVTKVPNFTSTPILTIPLIDPILMFIAYNIAIYIIGRYNTTSFLFLLFPFYLLLSYLLVYIMRLYPSLRLRFKSSPSINVFYTFIILTLLMSGFLSFLALKNEVNKISTQDYDVYLNEIRPYIQDDSIILGNLSSGFILNNNTFYDIRNLNYLEKSTIEHYIIERHINVVIYYEEYDYIERNPQWSILYGDNFRPSELKTYLNKNATLIHTFTDTYYGSRIIKYMGDYPWKIDIYTLEP